MAGSSASAARMAGDDAVALDVARILQKLQFLGFCLDLDSSGSKPFDRILSIFLKEIHLRREIRQLPPMLGDGRAVNLTMLFAVVRRKGGYDAVSAGRLWGWVAYEIGLESGVGPCLKLIYRKYLDALDRWWRGALPESWAGDRAGGKKGLGSAPAWGLPPRTPSRMECGSSTSPSNSKREQFLSPVRGNGRVLQFDDGGSGRDAGVMILEPNVTTSRPGSRRGDHCAKPVRENGHASKPGGGGSGKGGAVWSGRELLVEDGGSDKKDDAVFGKTNAANGGELSPAVNGEFSLLKRKRDGLVDMLNWVRCLAKAPKDTSLRKGLPNGKDHAITEHFSKAMSAREAMFIKKLSRRTPDGASQQAPKLPENDMDKGLMAAEEENLGKRKARNSNVIPNDKPRRIPVGRAFQVTVPKWAGRPSITSSDTDDLKWLGTKIWPPENQETRDEDCIGKGRQENCQCERPGSVVCARLHVAESRLRLKHELGSAFYTWRFHHMGEEVSLSWTEEEEREFKDIVRQNLPSELEGLWDQLRLSFPEKGREDLVSYYFNVFLLGRRGCQNRMTPNNIDSDEEDFTFGFFSSRFGHGAVRVSEPVHCAQNSQPDVNED